jgi:hypothetical protein
MCYAYLFLKREDAALLHIQEKTQIKAKTINGEYT